MYGTSWPTHFGSPIPSLVRAGAIMYTSFYLDLMAMTMTLHQFGPAHFDGSTSSIFAGILYSLLYLDLMAATMTLHQTAANDQTTIQIKN